MSPSNSTEVRLDSVSQVFGDFLACLALFDLAVVVTNGFAERDFLFIVVFIAPVDRDLKILQQQIVAMRHPSWRCR